jgi:hypothetical protein
MVNSKANRQQVAEKKEGQQSVSKGLVILLTYELLGDMYLI